MDYRVDLDVFHGPLDLLLYLIKRDELDILDIPIARITDSYMTYLQELKHASREHGFDINVAGDFLVMAATLMEIKSAMLLPRQELEPVEGQPSVAQQLADPRFALVQQLLEYKRFKDSAGALERRQQMHENRFRRYPALRDDAGDEPPPLDLDEVQIWDLLAAFTRLMEEVGRKPKFHEVVYDDTPIDLHAADIEDRVTREGKLSLRALFAGRKSRSEMIGVFLALLELIREKRVLAQTQQDGEEIEIVPAPEEHRRTFVGASLHLSDTPGDESPPPSREEVEPQRRSDAATDAAS
jgi:segregation and condensation protein A